jgi:hypothetical protein
MRVARSRQTMAYAESQRCRFSPLDKARMTLWTALELLDEVPRCASLALAAIIQAILGCEWCGEVVLWFGSVVPQSLLATTKFSSIPVGKVSTPGQAQSAQIPNEEMPHARMSSA